MGFEENAINLIKNASSDCEGSHSRNLKYIALDLLTESYNVQHLAARAKEEGIAQRLGYICDVTAKAAQISAIPASKASQLAQELYRAPTNWQYLDSTLPDFAKRIIAHSSSQTELNNKWKVYAAFTPTELTDWIDLYITEEYATTPKRQRA
ncbi:hypothetical protein KY346_01220 [Candidatus Woesearchaeota archaeon]|nr:hypothetical protein [Candidatus Woesearchaeota archaeon]